MNPRRYRMTALLALSAGMVGPSTALADYPVFEIPARFATSSGVGVVVDGTKMSAPKGTPGGSAGSIGWCTPYGNSQIVGFSYLLGAWHSSLDDTVLVQEEGDNGSFNTILDKNLPRQTANGYGSWSAGMTPTQCVGVKIVVRRALPHAGAWTTDLQRVQLRDLQGPSLSNLAAPDTWQTGDALPWSVAHADNDLGRGALLLSLNDGPSDNLGDPANGTYHGVLNIRYLADGPHVLRLWRSANGWATTTHSTTFRIDHTVPAVPPLTVDNESWTNAESVDAHMRPSGDGNGSGWNRNQFRINEGAWSDGPLSVSLTAQGEHSIQARAIDNVGHASAAGPVRWVRIDRTAPRVATLNVEAQDGRVTVTVKADDGLSGLGTCGARVSVENATNGTGSGIFQGPSDTFTSATTLAVPMTGKPAGQYRVTAHVCDRAGNQATRSAMFMWNPPGATDGAGPTTSAAAPGSGSPSAAAPAPTGPTTAGVTPQVAPAPAASWSSATVAPHGPYVRTRYRWWRPVVVRAKLGKTAWVRGRLMVGRRPAERGRMVQVRDAAGIIVARGRVRSDGAVLLRFRHVVRGNVILEIPLFNSLRLPVRPR